jgi:hypothetical protein
MQRRPHAGGIEEQRVVSLARCQERFDGDDTVAAWAVVDAVPGSSAGASTILIMAKRLKRPRDSLAAARHPGNGV